jgi:hypothetical protein
MSLSNIEFRLNNIISSRHDGTNPRRQNFHVIFSNEVPVEEIEQHFLHDLTFAYEADPQRAMGAMKLKIENIGALGTRLIAEHEGFKHEDPLKLGAKNIVVDLRDIKNALDTFRFRDKYFLVLPEELSSSISWMGQDHHTRKLPLQASDMVFSPNDKSRAWHLGLDPYEGGPEAFVREFKSLKPCVHGSDAHSIDRINRPCAKRSERHSCVTDADDCDMRFLWVKADPTFEGLRQLLCEPEDRVAIRATNPTPLRGGYTIDRFAIGPAVVSEELTMAGDSRPLGSGLVAVCGGKGAGKTAYVDLLAHCFADRLASTDSNSFVRRVLAPPSTAPGIKTVVSFKNGEEFSKTISERKTFQNAEIVYIPQGQLEQHISDSAALEQYANSLVQASSKVKNSVLRYEYEQLGAAAEKRAGTLRLLCTQIADLEGKTTEAQMNSLTVAIGKATAAGTDLRAQTTALQDKIGPEKATKAAELQTGIAELKSRRHSCERIAEVVQEALSFVDSDLVRFNALIDEAQSLMATVGISRALSNASYEHRDDLAQALEEANNLIAATVQNIDEAQQILDSYEADVRGHAAILERIAEADRRVADATSALELLRTQRQQLEEVRSTRDSLYTEMAVGVIDLRDKYQEMVTAFSEAKARVLSDLDFSPIIAFDELRFSAALEEVIDQRRVDVSVDGGASVIRGALDLVRRVTTGDRLVPSQLTVEIQRLAAELSRFSNPSRVLCKTSMSLSMLTITK